MNALRMIARCAKHQPDDAGHPRWQEIEATHSQEPAPSTSADYLAEELPPTPEATP